jgi:hypothetical protein
MAPAVRVGIINLALNKLLAIPDMEKRYVFIIIVVTTSAEDTTALNNPPPPRNLFLSYDSLRY